MKLALKAHVASGRTCAYQSPRVVKWLPSGEAFRIHYVIGTRALGGSGWRSSSTFLSPLECCRQVKRKVERREKVERKGCRWSTSRGLFSLVRVIPNDLPEAKARSFGGKSVLLEALRSWKGGLQTQGASPADRRALLSGSSTSG